MRMFYLAWSGVAAALSLAGAAQAQDPRLARLDVNARAGVVAVIDSLHAAGLPTEPLVQKALEGAAKRAAADRIVAAVRGLGRDLGVAHGALGPQATDAELTAGAAAVRGGVAASVLATVAQDRAGKGMLVPLTVLADLLTRGVPVDSAAAAVTRVAASGGRDADFRQLGLTIARNIDAGMPPAAAVGGLGPAHGPPPGVPGAINRGLRGRPPGIPTHP